MIAITAKTKRHDHMAYVWDRSQLVPNLPLPSPIGETSNYKNHKHEIFWDGQNLVAVGEDHSHALIPEYPVIEQKPETDEDKIVEQSLQLLKSSSSREESSRKSGRESWKFYTGEEQWDKKDKTYLDSQNRACLTINEIAAKVDLLAGYQRQNRSDLKVLPKEAGDSIVAEILTILLKNITDKNKFKSSETDAFLDQVVCGRGIFSIDTDFNDNIDGDIIISYFPWDQALFGPHRDWDLKDCEYVIKTKRYSKAKVKLLWPDKAEEIDQWFTDLAENGNTIVDNPGDQYVTGVKSTFSGIPLVDLARKEILVFEVFKKKYRESWLARDAKRRLNFDLDGFKKEDVKRLESITGLTTQRRVVYDIHRSLIGGKVLLENDIHDEDNFPLVPFYAKKSGDFFYGKVEEVKDAQREINKRRSQTVDWMNKMISSKYYIDKQTFSDPKQKKRFQQHGSTSGFIAEIADTNRPPEREDAAPLPNGLLGGEQQASESLQRIMNIPLEALGQPNVGDISGRAIIERRRQGLVANEFLFDNISQAKAQLGRLIIKKIKELYTPQRIIREVRDSRQRNDPMSEQLQGMQDIAIFQLLTTDDLIEYDVAVSQITESETIRAANFDMWARIAGQIPGFPMEFLVELSDLPEKEKMLGIVQQAQQQQLDIEKLRSQTEITKTQIAAQDNSNPSPVSSTPGQAQESPQI